MSKNQSSKEPLCKACKMYCLSQTGVAKTCLLLQPELSLGMQDWFFLGGGRIRLQNTRLTIFSLNCVQLFSENCVCKKGSIGGWGTLEQLSRNIKGINGLCWQEQFDTMLRSDSHEFVQCVAHGREIKH